MKLPPDPELERLAKWIYVYLGEQPGVRVTPASTRPLRADAVRFAKEFEFMTGRGLEQGWIEPSPGPRGGKGFALTEQGAKAITGIVKRPSEFQKKRAKARKIRENQPGICRVCGCTDHRACLDAKSLSCHWVEPDLCSACRDNPVAMALDALLDKAALGKGRSIFAYGPENFNQVLYPNLRHIMRALHIAVQVSRMRGQLALGDYPQEEIARRLDQMLKGLPA